MRANEHRETLFEDIIIFYKRPHSALGYQPPAEVERHYTLTTAA